MPLTLYAGPMKMGKTYEVVSEVMIPAYCSGRDIITNVRGVNPEYWEANLEPYKGRKRGSVTVVDDSFLLNEEVYPQFDKKNVRDPGEMPMGALVVIDEAYNVFGTDRGMVTARMLKWVMMHGHFTNDEGVCADVVMIAQDLSLLAPKVRNVAENVFWVRNLRFVFRGLGNRYRVTSYSSWRMNAKQLLGRKVRSYQSHIFSFYKSTSHAGGAGKLVATDRSQQAMGPGYLALCALALAGMIYGGWASWRSLSKKPVAEAESATVVKPDCAGSGILLDVSSRRALVDGEWRNVTLAPDTVDGRIGWDAGPCVFRFGGGIDRGSRSTQNGLGNGG